MEDPLINDAAARLRSEAARLRAHGKHRAASRQEFSPAGSALNDDGASSTWKKIKRIGNIPRDCSRFARRHARKWFGSIVNWTTRRTSASLPSLRELQGEFRRLEQAHRLQEARHLEVVSRCRRLAIECSALRNQLLEQADRCQDLEGQVAFLHGQLPEHEACRPRVIEEFQQKFLERETASEESKLRLDALYVAFADRFRGTQEDIKGRVQVYLPFLRDSGLAKEEVFDVGCGRGEWLELLREQGFQAWGVDSNVQMVERCRERGLDAVAGDAIALLRDLPDASLGAVTAFHVVEHLPLETLLELLRETLRVLKPGGLAIFETPNPENIQVGSCTFYHDPTHRNPLPWRLMHFLAEANGFCRLQVLKLHPCVPDLGLGNREPTEAFHDWLYGPQDYAVIGWKAVTITSATPASPRPSPCPAG